MDARRSAGDVQRVLADDRPVLYGGGGIVPSGASEELLALADALHFPVTPTLMGLGCFPSAHPLSLGMLGMHGTYWANMAITEADLILGIGVRFDDRVTGALDKFAPHAEIVHIDVDDSSLGKNVPTHWAIAGDAKVAMQQMLDLLLNNGLRPSPPRLDRWWKQIEDWKAHAPLTYARSHEVIKPQHLCEELERLTGGEAIIGTDVGQHQMWLAQYYGFHRPRQSFTSSGLRALGKRFPA